MQTTLFRRHGVVSNTDSKCPYPKTRAMQIAQKRSDRTSLSEQAGQQFFQPLFRHTQKRWGTPPHSRSQSAWQASFQDINAKADPGANSPRGLVCVRGFKRRVLSHSDSTVSKTVSEVCFRGHSVPILCSPVRASFSPTHLFKVHGCSSFPPQIERGAHRQLSGRLAGFSSVPVQAYKPHRLAAYSLGVPRAMCQHAEEHSCPESVHNISGSLLGLRGNESPPLARTFGGHFAPFQARQLRSVEEISEAARTNDGGVSDVSSGITTHAPAAAMAENSSPVDSVDFGMFEHRGHPRLHRSSEAVAQPRSLQPESSPGLGSVPRGGHDGCNDPWLGSSVRWNASFGTVVETPEPVAHKLPGAGSSPLSSKGFSAAAGTATCNDSHRQYVCGFVYKSPGRNSLQGAVQAGNGLPPSLYQSNAHPRSPEPRSGHAFEKGDSPRRVEITPRVGSDNLEPLRESRGGFVFNERERALPAVLLPVSLPAGRGRADITLASSQAECISSDQDIATGALCKIRQERASVLLIAPNWPNQPCFPDLTELLEAPPCPVPVRKDMLSQVDGSVWHPNPELWSLHVWPLQGY